jgi:ABC-type glycerol-3-phosphate transport system substrate-binding protein
VCEEVNALKRTGRLQLLIAFMVLSLTLGVPTFAAEGLVTVMIPATFLTDSWAEALELFTVKTGIKVEVVSVTGWDEMMQKVPVMVAGGVAPDAVYHDSGVQADLVANGSVRPIDDYIARNKLDLNLWPASVVRGYEYGGKMYSLPTGISNFTMYYNADRLEVAGIGALPTDWDHPTAFTFADMVSIGKKVTIDRDGDGVPEQYGLQDFFNSGAQALNMWSLDYVNDEQTAFTATSPAHIDAITQMRSLWQEHKIVGGNFLTGTAVMLPIQPYYLNSLYNAMRGGGFFTWKNAILPLVKCRCSYAAFHSWGMPRGSRNPDAGWEFVKFMTTDPQGAVLFSRAENRVPVLRQSIADFIKRWEQINPDQNVRVLTDSLNYVVRSKAGGLPRTVWSTWYPMMQRVMRGQIDPLSGMREIEPIINAILKEFHEKR